jgi:DNA-binding IscR family transcriptional regulator
MRIANRFSIAVHILSLLGTFEGEDLTSEWMAGSIGVNPVIVRNVTGMLRRAGLVTTQQGARGAQVARPFKKITLLDVLKAVETEDLFSLHPNPNPNCLVGSRIQNTLEMVYERAQGAMEAELKATTLDKVIENFKIKAA